MRRLISVMVVLSCFAAVSVRAQEPEPLPPPGFDEPGDENEPAPAPTAASSDASTPDYDHALELQRKGQWLAAQKAFRAMLVKYPKSIHKASAEYRGGDNAFLGCVPIHESGPSARRIDVSVMGDGFTIDADQQAKEEQWARLCLDVLWNESTYSEYKDYFNYYFIRLASLEEGVDPALSAEQKAKIEEANKSKTRIKKTSFSTALMCKAAGPAGQVMADRNLVYKWLNFAAREKPGCNDDRLVIAFAKFGQLGMGGGGIANVGRPDKSITVHEFGHAFVGLLDEYTNNPGTPYPELRAPNASLTPDPALVPWAHFLKKKIPGVGVYEGGATYFKGVWRPSRECAMNTAGHNKYCPVCREAAILAIYSYVNPIDSFGPPAASEIKIPEGSDQLLFVTPMQPKKHALHVSWFVEPIATTVPAPEPKPDDNRYAGRDRIGDARGGHSTAQRANEDRASLDQPPVGAATPGEARPGEAKQAPRQVFAIGKMKPGRYRITVVVKDPTTDVILDAKHLLEERVTWWVTVNPRT